MQVMPRPSLPVLRPTAIEQFLYSMAPSQRARLECFYCCRKSAQVGYPGIKKFKCEKCDAVNHLDENGEITDPPSASTVRYERYADSVPGSNPSLHAGSPFCATCIKNQHLYHEALASYFPPEDTPDYAEYEKAFPAFKRGLEERYPQVCENCEQGALAWLKSTNYAAKADNLRRIMDKTRPVQLPYQSDWRILAVFLGGWMWFTSWMGQILWDIIALANSETAFQGVVGRYKDWTLSATAHLGQIMGLSEVVMGSTELINSVAGYALVLGLFSLWWNPRLQLWLEIKQRGRIVGKRDFYMLQVTAIAIRCAAWAYIALSDALPDSRITDTIHYCTLFFGALFTYMSFRPIRIDYTPRIIFQDLTPERLISQRSQPTRNGIGQQSSGDFAQNINTYTAGNTFSIGDFAPQTQPPIPAPAPYRPLTPPTDDEGDIMMDWTPSHAVLPPAPLYRPIRPTPQSSQSGPFHGHLPANIMSPAHRLRNPPKQPVFRTASMIKKQMLFKSPNKQSLPDKTSETSGLDSLSVADLSPMKVAEPRFFPNSDHHGETGLENLFGNICSIAEEPAEVRAAQQLRAQSSSSSRSAPGLLTSWWIFPMILVLAVAVGYKLDPWQRILELAWLREFLALND